MTAAAERIACELERRYLITVERGGVVHLYDTSVDELRDGWPVFSTHVEKNAVELVRTFAKRTVDGDGWITRAPWHGEVRDLGELRYRLGLAYDALLGRLGRE